MITEKHEAFDKCSLVGNYLGVYFGQDQGVRLGESTVVSRKAHAVVPGKKGHVRVLVNRDAGKTFQKFIDPDQLVHMDIFHKPGVVDPRQAAKLVFWAIENHLVEENHNLKFMEDERFKSVLDYALRIEISTRAGGGTVYDLFQGEVRPASEEEEKLSHVHVLARLTPDRYSILLPVAEAIEEAVMASGLELVKVKKLSHGREKDKQENFAGFLILPWKKSKGEFSPLLIRENQNQLLLKLAERFANLEEVEDFLESYTSNIFRRKSKDEQKRKWGDLDHCLDQLLELGLLKNTMLGPVITREGRELQQFLRSHKCELEAELRRSIRKTPGTSKRFQKMGKCEYRPSQVEFTNRNKTVRLTDKSWSGDLAVPETVVEAKKRSLLRGESHLTVHKEDLHIYDRRSYVPIDVCLVIDASASMAGEKRQAACYLAEHILLTGREKVAVVTFQEMNATVAVPFTRNHKVLSRGLARIRPGGLTPMADGIFTAVELIKSSKASNPLMILISDGMPNFPLWSFDAKGDVLEAAEKAAEAKIKFVCVGLEANKVFLREVAKRARGTLYVVDDLNRDCLINIVKQEKKAVATV
ncbi:MAG: VWA domain-containing protein [Syntrophomonadaceae bacterium]|jgi:magnesium chelatase subunit D|nr:VWA domain-containing protein [Syntrophomonadaceae bacterium]MDH7497489.1 VWA domain-containing protein [Syntrophomonadaceae bacterium]